MFKRLLCHFLGHDIQTLGTERPFNILRCRRCPWTSTGGK